MSQITELIPHRPPFLFVDAIVSDPNARTERVEVRKEVTEEQRPDGVVLRRTVIEEVVLPPGTEPSAKTADGAPPKA